MKRRLLLAEDAVIDETSVIVAESEADERVLMALDNKDRGSDKRMEFTLKPTGRGGRNIEITQKYSVDYGWNLLGRYAGLYVRGHVGEDMKLGLAKLSAMLASFPNVDYKDQPISVADVVGSPILYLGTRAPRTLDDVAMATDEAEAKLVAFMKKAGLSATGPRRTITTNYGDENYVFDVAIPVSAATFTTLLVTAGVIAPPVSSPSGRTTGA